LRRPHNHSDFVFRKAQMCPATFRKSPVHYEHLSKGANHDVFGLQIAVNEAAGVCKIQRCSRSLSPRELQWQQRIRGRGAWKTRISPISIPDSEKWKTLRAFWIAFKQTGANLKSYPVRRGVTDLTH
jgi:hypothetical protein